MKYDPVMEDDESDSCSDEEDTGETGPSLKHVLTQLGLQDYMAVFESEQIDMEALVCLLCPFVGAVQCYRVLLLHCILPKL